MLRPVDAYEIARGLLEGSEGENPEYERALIEFLADAFESKYEDSMDDAIAVARKRLGEYR